MTKHTVTLMAIFVSLTSFHVDSQQEATPYPKEFPVMLGRDDDGFPNKIQVDGSIVDITFAHSCGLTRNAGTLKIKLNNKVSGYNDEFIYVVVSCLIGSQDREKFLNKRVCMNVTKTVDGYPPLQVFNRIDSHGTPFYYLWWSTARPWDFIKKFECNQ